MLDGKEAKAPSFIPVWDDQYPATAGDFITIRMAGSLHSAKTRLGASCCDHSNKP